MDARGHGDSSVPEGGAFYRWELFGRDLAEIARALATEPELLLFDEPFSGIDPIAVFEIQEIIYDLRAKGLGILLTDHNVRETLAITDRAYIMEEGSIWLEGEPAELVNHPDARRLYLGERFHLDVSEAKRATQKRSTILAGCT